MSEIDQIKIDIAETKAELKHAKDAEDFARRDRLETLLIEQQKKKNILLANQGEFHPALSNSIPSTFKLMDYKCLASFPFCLLSHPFPSNFFTFHFHYFLSCGGSPFDSCR